MAMSARRPSIQERRGPVPVKNQVCKYWLRGGCNRNPCNFLHSDRQAEQKMAQPCGNPVEQHSRQYTWKNPNKIGTGSSPFQPKALSAITAESEKNSTESIPVQPKVLADVTAETEKNPAQNPQPKQCKYWVTGNCVHGDNCKDMHSRFSGSGFQLLAKLEGHNKIIGEGHSSLEMAQLLRTARRRLLRTRHGPYLAKNTVCRNWLKGKCNRNPCKFMHDDPQAQQKMALVHPGGKPVQQSIKCTLENQSKIAQPVQPEVLAAIKAEAEEVHKPVQPKALAAIKTETEEIRKPVQPKALAAIQTETEEIRKPVQPKALAAIESETEETSTPIQPNVTAESDRITDQKPQTKQCKYWVTNSCVLGEKCQDIHSWFSGSGFQMLAKLEGHNKAVTGIVLPSGSDKLYSGGEDRSLRVWDCHSGQCVGVSDTNADVGCLITYGPWLVVGLTNIVMGWNTQNNAEFSLNAPVGLVCSIDVDADNLYAGMEDGTIFVWKRNAEKVIPEPAVVLKGHTGAVNSVIVGGSCMLYSGSKDGTIKRWDRQNMQCVETLYGHTAEVTSLVCWDTFLLSASLDKTIKVWSGCENGKVELVYERKEDDGVLVLCGIPDSENKTILLCSCLDNTVRLYDIPSFNERGRIFSKREVRTIRTGIDKHFFTGDASGEVSAWHLL